jgi:hypothetical protein
MNFSKRLIASIVTVSFSLLLFLSTNLSMAQNVQLGASLGPSVQYVHEHHYGNVEYYEGLSFQADFTFLDDNKLAKYGFSAYSNSVKSFYKINERYRYNGLIANTGLVISRYFERQLSKKFIANVQLGTDLNLETDYFDRSRLTLNLTLGAEVKYAIADNWFLLVKGIAVAQDVPNIVRYYTYGDSRQAGEDLHLISLFGIATNIGRK